MLQRIQTIFLGIIPVALTIMQFLPIWAKIEPNTLHNYTLYAWKLQELYPAANLVNIGLIPYVVLDILAIPISILAIYEICRYDSRVLQLQLGAINSLLLTILIGGIVYGAVKSQESCLPGVEGHYQMGFYMPLVAVVSNMLATYFIRKDERLVQSASRIR